MPHGVISTAELWSPVNNHRFLNIPKPAKYRSQQADVIIESATASDVSGIVAVLVANRDDPGLFRERGADVQQKWPDFTVARNADGMVVGCAGLHHDPGGWAEIFGVAVLPHLQGQGIGSRLVLGCIEKAAANGGTHLWLGTMRPSYFARFSFQPTPPTKLPAAILRRKLRQVFHQSVKHWAPVLLGYRHSFMRRDLEHDPRLLEVGL